MLATGFESSQCSDIMRNHTYLSKKYLWAAGGTKKSFLDILPDEIFSQRVFHLFFEYAAKKYVVYS